MERGHHQEGSPLEPSESHEAASGGPMSSERVGDPLSESRAGPEVASRNVHEVLSSEIGISTLLNRLKQTIASGKEFAVFLKKRSSLEEDQSAGLRKLCRSTAEVVRKPDQRHGTFLSSIDELTGLHDRMADNGAQFAAVLLQMHDELNEMINNLERGRKHWKTTGLNAEQRAVEMETAMRKSKSKYDALAEDYDRVRTGDRQSGKIFGLKGPKSAAQHEEDLLRKVQAADTDYAQKVQVAQSSRMELWSKLRPEAVKALADLIREGDSALTMQMQRFGSCNEKLLLSNGLNVSPINTESGQQHRSLREVITAIDNEGDMNFYLNSYASKIPPRAAEIRYERSAVLGPQQSSIPPVQQYSEPPPPPPPPPQTNAPPNRQGTQGPASSGPTSSQYMSSNVGFPQPPIIPDQRHERSPSYEHIMSQQGPPGPPPPRDREEIRPSSSNGPPQLSALPFQSSQALQHNNPALLTKPTITPEVLPPLNPVFGRTLEELFDRDKFPVPEIVSRCIQAIDLFGLEVEGIYRLSGSAVHVQQMKAIFDNGTKEMDFRNPENFFHDVNSVAGLVKQFFRELPDPVLTAEHYQGFIDAAKHEDPILRRDSLHALINALPDPNYATLRAITLHLNRVQEHSNVNRMTTSNIAIVWGPTLMGSSNQGGMQDAGWFVRVIQTILENTYQIFDDD